jgi:repressor LexA
MPTCVRAAALLDSIPYIRMVSSRMPSLAPKQLEVLAFIQRFMTAHAFPPTRGEIAEGLKLKNRQGIDQHLRALQAKGAIELLPGISRGIRIRESSAATSFTFAQAEPVESGLPLLGRIAAGSPILASGNIEDRIQVDASLFRPHGDFVLRVRGDSMKNADIVDRDLLVVHQTSVARNGQIVVARLDEEATVKYYRRKGHIVRLEPANPAYEPIEVDLRKQSLVIEGLAVGIIRPNLKNQG